MPHSNRKVHIVDDDSKRRAEIAYGLNSNNLLAQIYENLEELFSFGPKEGLLLLNDSIAGTHFPEIAKSIGFRSSALPVAIFGENPTPGKVVDAMLSGAIDYLEWPFDARRIEQVIARFENDAHSQFKLLQRRRDARLRTEALTPRERDVLRHLIRGFGNKEMASSLDISPRTVEVHRAKMLEKLNARSSSDAVRIGIYAGLDD